jgi:hypothetical protein
MERLNARRRASLALLALPAIRAGAVLAALPAWADVPVGTRIDLPRFSVALAGSRLPSGWTPRTLTSVERANRFDLVADQGGTVLRVISDRSASSLAAALRVDPAVTPLLHWRWRVSQAVAGSDLRRKAGDDYAARVYVLFDLPPERLGFGDRMRIAAARLLHGADLPAAALCYVWGTAQSVGESGWNAYTDRLRMIVVDSGNALAGQWREVVRDVAADFRAAFGEPVPMISGVALAADTDNTGTRVEARFGDLWFEARS